MSNEQLAVRIKAGIDTGENMEQLWQQVKDYVAMLARKYKGQAEQEDLIQEGYLALYDAIDGFWQIPISG